MGLEIHQMTNPKSLIDDVIEWAELVIMELRIDSERGSWDRLDKLEDAVAALKASAVEPSAPPAPLACACIGCARKPKHGECECEMNCNCRCKLGPLSENRSGDA